MWNENNISILLIDLSFFSLNKLTHSTHIEQLNHFMNWLILHQNTLGILYIPYIHIYIKIMTFSSRKKINLILSQNNLDFFVQNPSIELVKVFIPIFFQQKVSLWSYKVVFYHNGFYFVRILVFFKKKKISHTKLRIKKKSWSNGISDCVNWKLDGMICKCYYRIS